MANRQCVHAKGASSTLRTAFTAEVNGMRFWWVYCDACGSRTILCLTPGEAVALAVHGWWSDSYPSKFAESHAE